MSDEPPIKRVLEHLENVEKHNGYYKALCPVHNDQNPSLEIKEAGENGQKKVLVKCYAGCDKELILKQLGLEWKDLFSTNGTPSQNGAGRKKIEATYDYTSPTGELLHQTVRFEPKKFSQRQPDSKGGWEWSLKNIEPVLYKLPQVYRAILDGEIIFVVEGEKDADRAREELGITATTCPMGAGKWRESYNATLRGAKVVLVPDNDEAGRNHILKVAQSLYGTATSVKVLDLPDLPEKGDLSDWLDAGGNRETFDALVENTAQIHSAHIGKAFGQNESLPIKTVSEVLAESGEGPDWKVKSLLAGATLPTSLGRRSSVGKQRWQCT